MYVIMTKDFLKEVISMLQALLTVVLQIIYVPFFVNNPFDFACKESDDPAAGVGLLEGAVH